MNERDRWNGARFVARDEGGHYESWFQRANHPTRPLAFWIRYTIFSPKGRAREAIGELWAVFFDGERGRVVAVKEEHPLAACRFAKSELDVRIAESTLDARRLEGSAESHGHRLRWNLDFTSPEPLLLLLPRSLYGGGFPKAKMLVGSPNAVFDGALDVDGDAIAVDGWVGLQNHNWGSKHTDRYAWGQVAGFDDAPDAFLELGTGQVKVGPMFIPRATLLVLRLEGEELRLNALHTAVRARSLYEPMHWAFSTRAGDARVSGTLSAERATVVGLPYLDPPGGTRTCLNSKLARCHLVVERGGRRRTLTTAHRAAFEILTDGRVPGISMLGDG